MTPRAVAIGLLAVLLIGIATPYSDLVMRGNGDPSLVPERVWYLATRVLYAGVREVGDIVVDDGYFAGPRHANGSEQDHSDSAYMAPTGAVSVGFNALLVHVSPGPVAGDPRPASATGHDIP